AGQPGDPLQNALKSPLESAGALLAQLDQWVALGWLRALDRALAGFLLELEPGSDPALLLAAALVSHQLGHGHICMDLAATLAAPDLALSLPPEGQQAAPAALLPSQLLGGLAATEWLARLAASPLVDSCAAAPETPLVLVGQRLYLRRYWRYERDVMAALHERVSRPPTPVAWLSEGLAELFVDAGQGDEQGADQDDQPDWQRLACALAARGAFSIITGGPGTGKTTAVVRLLALLQSSAVASGQPLRIRLAAPTGKAATRLTESIGRQVGDLAVPETVRQHIPTTVSTLHRLLGSRMDSRHFRHHAGNPLPLDVLVVDEASMIDLEMMASLLAALPRAARLILLGDKDQLSSVEAGAVLGDLCRHAEAGHYTEATVAWLESVSGQSLAAAGLRPGVAGQHALAQQTVMLRRSHRFGANSGIGELARAVNRCDVARAASLLGAGEFADIAWRRVSSTSDPALAALVLGRDNTPGYGLYLRQLQAQRPASATPGDIVWEAWARTVLATFDQFQLLCAVRRGDWGVEAVNVRVAALLQGEGLLPAAQGWYEGRPVMVTRNNYSLGLMNGDVGITLQVPVVARSGSSQAQLRVAFPRNDGLGGIRFVLPSQLTDAETVFAMTVHKSQGSEFSHVALVLPERRSPVLTKELVYTGITRASQRFTLVTTRAEVFEQAVATPVRRISGLLPG
ncbi:MAG TPA: exodeoxyribonuclease V subunit alpha, partial [Kineobactrum sp.]